MNEQILLNLFTKKFLLINKIEISSCKSWCKQNIKVLDLFTNESEFENLKCKDINIPFWRSIQPNVHKSQRGYVNNIFSEILKLFNEYNKCTRL